MHQLNEGVRKIAYWSKFTGYLTLIAGFIYAIGGLAAMVIGAIPGVIMIFLGLYQVRAGKRASSFLHHANEGDLIEMTNNLGKFFRLQGIMTLIGLILGVVGGIILVIAGVSIGTNN